LKVRMLVCEECGTEIRGDFTQNPFSGLTEEQLDFLYEFLKTWGNFSELARKLNVSYPTVRNRYEEILRSLGLLEDL